VRFVKERPGQSGIIYARTRKTCDEVAKALECAEIEAAV
jgi:superfamily II DNA helicase RecQ